jgi:hypothetical protein
MFSSSHQTDVDPAGTTAGASPNARNRWWHAQVRGRQRNDDVIDSTEEIAHYVLKFSTS